MNIPFKKNTSTKKRLGLVVLQSDETVEHELNILLQPLENLTLLHSRIPSAKQVTSHTLSLMESHIASAVALFPQNVNLDTIGYACTSGSAVIGENIIHQTIQSIHPDTPTTNPLTALKEAIRTLHIKKIAFISPYILEVSKFLIASIEKDFPDLSIDPILSYQQKDEHTVASICPESTLNAIVQARKDHSIDAVFVSCTNLSVLPIIPVAEKNTSIPILSSNTLLLWHMLRLAKINCSSLAPIGGMVFSA